MEKKITKLLMSSMLVVALASTTVHAGRASTENEVNSTNNSEKTDNPEKTDPKNKDEKEETGVEASPPTLKISGFSAVNLVGVSQKDRANGKGAGYHMENAVSDLYFVIAGRSTSNLAYKYELVFEAIPGEGLEVAQNFIELEKGIIVQIGAADDITRAMLQDGSRVLGGMGGFSAPLDRYFNFSSGVFNNYRMLGDTKYATKFVIYSPEWQGLRIGFCFTPNTSHKGDKDLNTAGGKAKSSGNSKGIYPSSDNSPFGLHSMAFGAGYNRTLGDWNLKFSAVGIFDRSYLASSTSTTYYRTRVRDVKSYQLGGIIGYGKYEFGAGWLDNGRSRLPYDGNLTINGASLGDTWKGNSGKAWNIAANYTEGAYQFALGHQYTFRKTDAINKATNSITSATFNVTPLQGLKLYVEADYIRTKTNPGAVQVANDVNSKTASQFTQGIGNNKGLVTLTGIAVSF